MDYVNGGDTVVIRLDPNEQVLDSLAAVCDEPDIEYGFLTGTGAVDVAMLGHYDVDDQEYPEEEFTGQFEVTSFLGNIGLGKTHTHIQVGTCDLGAFDGHRPSACVSGTFGVVIHLGEAPSTHHLNK